MIGHDAPDSKEKRPIHRPAHLAHLRAHATDGKVPLAGPFTDGSGSLVESLAAAWAIIAHDPYVVHGIFNHVEVKPFLRVFPEDA